MPLLLSLVAVLMPALLAVAFLILRHFERRRQSADPFSPVTRQHFELFQGGNWNEAALESAKRRFRDLLERGEVATVEASLRPGIHYVFQVRALAEIGTDVAGRILERQLQRRLSDDQLEQSWYWIDLAGGLRAIHREESLPHLLRCADSAGEVPLGHFFAAETVCFLGFSGYLREADSPLGRSALRLLHRAIEGLRFGVQPQLVTEARLGETLENLWDHRELSFDPLLARIAGETLRFLRRSPHARDIMAEDRQELEAFDWQLSRLAALEPVFEEYVAEAPACLADVLGRARGDKLVDALQAVVDLRADVGEALLPLLKRIKGEPNELLIEALTWSKSPQVGAWLRDYACSRVFPERRAGYRRRAQTPLRASVPANVPYRSVLRAMRGQPSPDAEEFLALAARDWDPIYRAAAFSSLGWWQPIDEEAIRAVLHDGRRDPNPDVRQAARAALARLGERAALHWFRQGLSSEDPQHLQETIHLIAAEGLFMLWPDLDRLTESRNADLAQLATESLERMSEEIG